MDVAFEVGNAPYKHGERSRHITELFEMFFNCRAGAAAHLAKYR